MGLPALPSMIATWLTGKMGKSTSRQVLGRFGSLKSTVSMPPALPAPTILATSCASCSFLVAISVFLRQRLPPIAPEVWCGVVHKWGWEYLRPLPEGRPGRKEWRGRVWLSHLFCRSLAAICCRHPDKLRFFSHLHAPHAALCRARLGDGPPLGVQV